MHFGGGALRVLDYFEAFLGAISPAVRTTSLWKRSSGGFLVLCPRGSFYKPLDAGGSRERFSTGFLSSRLFPRLAWGFPPVGGSPWRFSFEWLTDGSACRWTLKHALPPQLDWALDCVASSWYFHLFCGTEQMLMESLFSTIANPGLDYDDASRTLFSFGLVLETSGGPGPS